MYKLISKEEIEQEFQYNNSAFQYFRSVWDSFQAKNTGLNKYEISLGVLAKTFPTHAGAARYQPIGDFKDFKDPENLDRESIYEKWCSIFEEERLTANGEYKSFVEVACQNAYQLQQRIIGYKKYSIHEIVKGMSFMLWRCTEGVVRELNVVKELQKKYNKNGFKIVPAPSYYEKYDVDAILKNSCGEDVVYFSIKNLGALSEHTMNVYRNQKKKTKPMLYIGFNKDEELSWLYPPEWNKKSLREHVDSGGIVNLK